ncbi:Aggrecan core protein, partial [Toxocara canis]
FADAQSSTAAPRMCPMGWTRRMNNCYFVFPGQTTYLPARAVCQRLGAQMVSFDTRDELQFVNTLAISQGVTTYWIGLNLVFGAWVRPNGQPTPFTNWRPTQPDRCCGRNVTCVLVNYANQLGQWDDAGCETIWRNPQGNAQQIKQRRYCKQGRFEVRMTDGRVIVKILQETQYRPCFLKVAKEMGWDMQMITKNIKLYEGPSASRNRSGIRQRCSREIGTLPSQTPAPLAIKTQLDSLEEFERRAAKVIDPYSPDFDPIYVVATVLDPNNACLVDDGLKEVAETALLLMVHRALKAVALRVLSMPASSAPVERVLQARIIIGGKRLRMEQALLEKKLFLYVNCAMWSSVDC